MHTVSATYLQTLGSAMVGLLGEETPYPVYFKTRWGIHTFGMKFPIDVIILDDTYRVVRTRIALPPNRVFVWNPRFHHVIELPAHTVPKQRIQMGEKIQIVNTRRS